MNQDKLPSEWLDRIFAELRANYGAAFDRMWQAPEGVDPAGQANAMRLVWGRELAGFKAHPYAVRYALDHLPLYAPNLPEFRALCNRAPAPEVKALQMSKPDQARLAAELAKLRAFRAGIGGRQ